MIAKEKLAQYDLASQTYNNKIQELKERRAAEKARYEAALKNEQDVVDKIAALGFKPTDLKPEIERGVAELDAYQAELARVMPNEFGAFVNAPVTDDGLDHDLIPVEE